MTYNLNNKNISIIIKNKLEFKPVYIRNFGLVQVTGHRLNLPPQDTFILYSPALEQILFDRSLVGWELQKSTYRTARALFEALKDNLMQQYPMDSRFEQVNLAGSDWYMLQPAYAKVYNSILPRNYIAIKRFPIPGVFDEYGKQKFATEISYKRFEAKGSLCILGETIATGASLVDSLEAHLPYAIENGLKRMLIFTICGSKIGAERVYETIKKFGVEVTFIFGLGIFGLGKDGTALLWHDIENKEKALTLPEFEERSKKAFLPGECAIGDWGKRFTNTISYLQEWRKELTLLGHPERFRVPEEYKEQMREEL